MRLRERIDFRPSEPDMVNTSVGKHIFDWKAYFFTRSKLFYFSEVRLLTVRLNGSEISFSVAQTLEKFLIEKGLELDCVVVEYNGNIVKPKELAAIVLQDQDEIEVLRFVGGG